jgi:hypothetical protein
LVALANLATGANAAESAPLKRAGIVSLLGESPQWVLVGAGTAPGQAEQEPAQKWEMDYFVETVVGRHVAAHGFDPIVPDKAARAALPSIEEFARRERLDTVFIVAPARMSTQFKESPDAYTGYGIWSRDTTTGCFAAIRISVMDVKLGRVVREEAESRARRSKDREVAGKRMAQLSESQALIARECIEDLMETVQDLALRKMGY